MTMQEMAMLPKSYQPADWEPVVRERWENSRCFHAEPRDTTEGGREPYCILIPPPNVTAALHLGHALNNTLQDVLVRYHRMRGYNTLWMPGTDHAGIATQAVVEKRLMAEGKRRTDFTRDQFVGLVQEWKDEYEATITEQLKQMGCSCDWERQRFTMDEMCATAVREAFFRLFKDGLIYRGKRLVNWDPVTQTALADDEVEMEEVQGHMWYLRYPLVEPSPFGRGQGEGERDEASDSPSPPTPLPEGEGGYITVATTRPETMLGDTAVAINPKDPRAAKFVGRMVRLPIVGREIPIIADDYVVRPVEFGGDPADGKAAIATGFLKVTPAHDQNDWEIGQRHNLPVINVMAPDASISTEHGWDDCSEEAQQFVGLSREDCRDRIVAWFKEHDLLEDVKNYEHSVGHSYRSHVPIEPYLSDQWYVKVTDDRLVGEAQRALGNDEFEGEKPQRETASVEAEGDGELRFFPLRYAKSYQAWHENLRDWCISRQLWWGHRIPVWRGVATESDRAFIESVVPEWDAESVEDGHVEYGTWTIERQSVPWSWTRAIRHESGEWHLWHCLAPGNETAERQLEANGYTQDPDVLDTWFSSGLWPLSTMGWPDPAAYPETEGLLDVFNPSSVLCTAREIITLWVSRMVMFNRYFTGDHRVPYRHVYIHPMIQDGHGQKMSKSLGNGVDPRDIIHTHGADALRFVMVQLATSTQDVRIPIDMMCPHCEHAFHPREITTSARHRVAAPEQTCPSCGKKMVSVYGAVANLARPSTQTPLARNTSTRFDLGRNFCNKLWNATRFALSNLETGAPSPPTPLTGGEGGTHSMCDKWIIARLHRTLHKVEDALAEYQFNAYAEAMYDFIWRDFCDWYLESIKPTVKSSAAQQQVLRTVLNAAIRLLHPICPFVTEALWTQVAACGAACVDGIELPDSTILASAPWPDISCSVDDKHAHDQFERVRDLVETIRTIRGEQRVRDRDRIALFITGDVNDLIDAASPMVESLCGIASVERFDGPPPEGAIRFHFEGAEMALRLPKEEIDVDALRERLRSDIAALEKQIEGRRGRLNNPGYVDKAPEALVQQTRDELAKFESERSAKQSQLDELGS